MEETGANDFQKIIDAENKVPLAIIRGLKINWQQIELGASNNGWNIEDRANTVAEIDKTISTIAERTTRGVFEGDYLIYHMNAKKALDIYNQIRAIQIELNTSVGYTCITVGIELEGLFRDFDLQRMENRIMGSNLEQEATIAIEILEEKGHIIQDAEIYPNHISIFTSATPEIIFNTPDVCYVEGKRITIHNLVNNKAMMYEVIQKIKEDRRCILEESCYIAEEKDCFAEKTEEEAWIPETVDERDEEAKIKDILLTERKATDWKYEIAINTTHCLEKINRNIVMESPQLTQKTQKGNKSFKIIGRSAREKKHIYDWMRYGMATKIKRKTRDKNTGERRKERANETQNRNKLPRETRRKEKSHKQRPPETHKNKVNN